MSEVRTRDRLLDRRVSRVLGWASLVSLVVLALFGLWGAPEDAVQREAQRLMYLHVPTAWLAYLAFAVTALGSALFLWPRTRSMVWDRIAGASAELGVLFTALTLAMGSLWGKPVWGVWWAWDARLVTTAVLFFLYLGYLALRRIPSGDPIGAGKRNAIAALIAFVDVPIVHFSVEWWNTLHQGATIRLLGKSTMDPAMLPPLIAMTLGTKLWFVGSLLARTRAALIDQESGKDWVRQLFDQSRLSKDAAAQSRQEATR